MNPSAGNTGRTDSFHINPEIYARSTQRGMDQPVTGAGIPHLQPVCFRVGAIAATCRLSAICQQAPAVREPGPGFMKAASWMFSTRPLLADSHDIPNAPRAIGAGSGSLAAGVRIDLSRRERQRECLTAPQVVAGLHEYFKDLHVEPRSRVVFRMPLNSHDEPVIQN